VSAPALQTPSGDGQAGTGSSSGSVLGGRTTAAG